MKNRNLINSISYILIIIIFSLTACSPNNSKENGEKKTISVTVEIGENGTTTTIDTVIVNGDESQVKTIVMGINKMVSDHEGDVQEVKVEVLADIDELKEDYHIEIQQAKDELKDAVADLQKELAKLKLNDTERERIDKAVKKLKEVDWEAHADHLKMVILDAHTDFMDDMEGEDVEIIIKGDDTIKIIKKVIHIDKDK